MLVRQKVAIVDIDSLPPATREDIAHTIAEGHPFFAERGFDYTDARDNLFGLAHPPKVLVAMAEVGPLRETMDRHCSAVAVAGYVNRLKADPQFEFDPILTRGEAFLEGGHRMEAYAQSRRRFIPIVDIGHLMNASADDWQAWFDGSTDPSNAIYGNAIELDLPGSLPAP